MNTLALAQTEKIITTAINKAKSLNIMVNIAIVDNAGYLINFKRMDGALLGAIDVAIKKAKTSALFGKPCHLLGEKSQPGGALYQIEQSNNGLITFAGGLPITNADGNVIAAVGVSGSTIENDLVVAQTAIAAF
jgi:uncharacterized protein GlcG (DUF336 family)